jgi:hypothetical protein
MAIFAVLRRGAMALPMRVNLMNSVKATITAMEWRYEQVAVPEICVGLMNAVRKSLGKAEVRGLRLA